MEFTDFQFNGRRSNVVAQQGIVATSQPLAAQIGLDILKSGGNAVDAAVATAVALCVVEPFSTGIGGDAFALIWQADEGKLYGLNASGPAPSALTADLVRGHGYSEMPTESGLAVTVPGSVRGWQAALDRFGSRGLDSLIAPTLPYARDGFPVSELIAKSWGTMVTKLSRQADSKRVWLRDGRSPRFGEIFTNPELFATLKAIADDGPNSFYAGTVAEQIIACVQADNGVMTLDDLANYAPEWVEPLALPYKNGFTFHEIPPNGQGLTALIALNMVKQMDLGAMGYGTAVYYHHLIETIKLAFADAAAYIADPRHANVPVVGLLADHYAKQRQALIGQTAITPQPGRPSPHGDTVYLTVADKDGNMVSWIQSLYQGFGSGLTAGKTGVVLQNRGANFSLEPGHPNEAQGGKRPYHTIIPGFITKDGQAWSSFGVMGGFMQPQGHLQVGLNLVEWEMSPQAALEAPRFNWQKDKQVDVETAVGETIWSDLKSRGHELDDAGYYGGGQVIVRDPDTGVYFGGSEPRNDGTAVGY